ncbi:purine-nucleoside phosphorylase [Vibrio lamellibrachiae]|uniref:purine-nucleoside phosphorylase n=1 Tax=Vibrio lamellibrachiae TaxID=2910253 RepID=UPI003D0A2102
MMTPHIRAKVGEFAETVLMPGDPLRAKFIAENYLDNPRLVTDVRNVLGYTGEYQGTPISIMAHGMGTPSISIYLHELITVYGVKKAIRVGSCGGVADHLDLKDIIVVTGAGTANAMNRAKFAGYDYPATPDFNLLRQCWTSADKLGIKPTFGNIFTNDFFYDDPEALLPALQRFNILAMDMETSALFTIAAEKRIQALSILTVSDHVVKGGEMSPEERQASFDQMIRLALDTLAIEE